jgi:hypothetical protein
MVCSGGQALGSRCPPVKNGENRRAHIPPSELANKSQPAFAYPANLGRRLNASRKQ